jgi:toxin-antitoxin system PIN domain toxin
VILVDTNLVVYATFADAPEHEVTRNWLQERLAGDGIVLCWPVVYSFIRIASDPRIFGRDALPVREAWVGIADYLARPAVRVVAHGSQHAAIAAELAATPGLRHEDVPDVELAALAIEHGLPLATHDSGFRRFPALRVIDPIGPQ